MRFLFCRPTGPAFAKSLCLSVLVNVLTAAFCLFVLFSATISRASTLAGPSFVPRAYFVEFHDPVEGLSIRDGKHASNVHDAFRHHLNNVHNVPYKHRFSFTDPRLILGMSLELENDEHVKILHGFPSTKKVHRVRKVKRATNAGKAFSRNAPPSPRSYLSHSPRATVQSSSTAVSDTNGLAGSADSIKEEPYRLIGADKLHAQGYFGSGQAIAMLDSGVDTGHHALNGGRADGTRCLGLDSTGRPCPISKGWAFVNDHGELKPGPDPFVDCLNGWHGTFTSGLLVAQAPDRNFSGIVPEAHVYFYRVFGCEAAVGVTDTDVVMAAMQRAFDDGAKIMTTPADLTDSWSDDSPMEKLATRLTNLGAHMVLSAGNLGPFGAFQATSPANTPQVYSVASVQNEVLRGFTARIVDGAGTSPSQEIVYFAANPVAYNETAVFPIYATTPELDPVADSCTSSGQPTQDLIGKAVLVAQSDVCIPVQQHNNLVPRGTRIILSYGSSHEAVQAACEANGNGTQLVGLGYETAKAMKAALAKDAKLSIDFSSPKPVRLFDTQYGGVPTAITGVGPSWDLQFTTKLMAPGGNSFSTWPVALGSYVLADASTFAATVAAGSVALYRSIKGDKETPAQVLSVFQSTAQPVIADKTTHVLDSVTRSGSGTIDVYKAVNSATRVSPASFALNDTRHHAGVQQLKITNIGTKTQQFTMKHLPVGTVHALDGSPGLYFRKGPLQPFNGQQAKVSFSPPSFSLNAGATAQVTVHITPPAPDQRNLPIYSGFVQAIASEALNSVSIAYLGVAADLAAYSLFETQNPPGLYTSKGVRITEDGRSFTLVGDDYPELRYWMLLGSARELAYLLHARTSYDVRHAGPIAPADLVATIEDYPNLDRSLGQPNIRDYGFTPLGRSFVDAETKKSVTVPEGEYRMLVRILRLLADPALDESWDAYLSPVFRVTAPPTTTQQAEDVAQTEPSSSSPGASTGREPR
ncbi:hypothetical protein V8E36_005462 [Tilletia maclaganii]